MWRMTRCAKPPALPNQHVRSLGQRRLLRAVLRLARLQLITPPRTPASLELVKGDTRLFCARGYRFLNPVAEDITGDKVPDLIRITHASGLQPTSYHQFLFTFVVKFRVQTIGPFVNEKNTQPK